MIYRWLRRNTRPKDCEKSSAQQSKKSHTNLFAARRERTLAMVSQSIVSLSKQHTACQATIWHDRIAMTRSTFGNRYCHQLSQNISSSLSEHRESLLQSSQTPPTLSPLGQRQYCALFTHPFGPHHPPYDQLCHSFLTLCPSMIKNRRKQSAPASISFSKSRQRLNGTF